MTWLRERPERWEELDTVDWQGKFISDQGDEEVEEDIKEEKEKGKGKGKLFDDEDDEDDDEEEEEEEEEVRPAKPPIVLASPAEVSEKGKGKGGRATTASPAVTPAAGKVRMEKVKGERTR
jgi:hypothetical protein